MFAAATSEYSFDLHRIFLGDHPVAFYLEIAMRSTLMFVFALLLLRLMGKRSLGQLSPFDFVIIIALGSAVGDPMFYDDVPLLEAMTVVAVVVALNHGFSKTTQSNPRIERFVESSPTVLIRRGEIDRDALRRESMSEPELFELLRLGGIENVDDVEVAILEASGHVSVLRTDSDVRRAGLWRPVVHPTETS